MEKLIITAALSGSQVKKEQNENLPVTPQEIAEDAYRCYNAGASVVHIHARDPRREKNDFDIYCECIQQIKEKCNIIVQISTGSRDRFGNLRNEEERIKLLDIKPKPDMISVNTGTFLFHNLSKHRPAGASKGWFLHMNTPELIEQYVMGAKGRGILPEFEIYNSGGVFDLERLFQNNILQEGERTCINLVMGVGGTQPCNTKSLLLLVESIPPDSHWCVMGIGRHEFPIVTAGIIMGSGGARVGLEDNIYLSKGVKATNAQLVERIVRIAKDLNREIATVEEARQIHGL